MKHKSLINNNLSTVGLLTAVLAIVFSSLMAAHANMADNGALGPFTEQHGIGSYKSVVASITSPMVLACNTSADGMESSHDGAECCSAMCGASVLITDIVLSDQESTHTHFASLEVRMKSADNTRLIRPPSL